MYFVVPHEVTAESANVWLGFLDEAVTGTDLDLVAGALVETASPWQQWPLEPDKPRLWHRKVRLVGLKPRTTYSLALRAKGRTVARARTTTLPTTVPLEGDKPFTVMLGSCFAHHEDRERRVGNTFFHLPHSLSPDVKLLAGDQVYLDSPWYRYLTPHTFTELRDAFLGHYARTWGQTDGFSRLLSDGANFFSSDDHEFWNNAPNFVAFAANTWTEEGRQQWWTLARELYSVFQTANAVTQFDVPPVSFLVADTRVNRDRIRANFMLPADLQLVDAWVRELSGPGVLVIGQPLLQTSTGFFKGHFGDWNLPDFSQYHELVQIIGRSRHSLVVLTGDVHFGRVARSSLRSGAELIEIISSPMSLVDEKARGTWTAAPASFPITRPSTMVPAALGRSGVVTEGDFAPTESHFLTLEFTRRGPGTRLRLRFWPVFRGGAPPPDFGASMWERTLK